MIPALTLIEDQISFYNVRRSGTGYNSATLLSAISDLGNTECVAYLPKGMEDEVTIWTIDQNVTFPENISVLIPCGVMLNVLAGIIITFEGPCFNQCPNWHTSTGQINLNSKTAINSQSYKDFFNAFIVAGGTHGLSPTCYSPNFFTEAYVANGEYIREDFFSIRYGDLGANCLNDVVWVVISNHDASTIPGTNFIRVPNTHYYIDFTSTTIPALPSDSAFLMEVYLQDDQITRVNDLRAFDAAQGLLERIDPATWIPELYPGSFTYLGRSGTYLRYGKLLYVSGSVTLSGAADLTGDPLVIRNLPFSDYIASIGGFTFHLSRSIRPGAGLGVYTGIIYPGSKEINIVENIAGGLSGFILSNRMLPNTDLYFTGTYIVNI